MQIMIGEKIYMIKLIKLENLIGRRKNGLIFVVDMSLFRKK